MGSWDTAARDRRSAPVVAALVLVGTLLVAWIAGSGSGGEAVTAGPDELDIERVDAPGDPLNGLPDLDRVAPATPWIPPEPGSWVRLPRAPMGPRVGHTVAAVDDLVVVWGGYQDERPMGNGAAFEMRTGRWLPLPRSPVRENGHKPVAVDTSLLLLHDTAPMSYEPAHQRWRLLPRPPLPDGMRLVNVTAWTGRVAIVLTADSRGRAGPALAFDPVRRAWAALPAPPTVLSTDHDLVWNGRDLLLFGRSADGDARGFGHRLTFGSSHRPTAGGLAWQPVVPPPLSDAAARASGVRAVPSGSVRDGAPTYVWVGPRLGGEDAPRLLAFTGGVAEPGTGERWLDLGTPPLRETVPTLLWTGEDLLAVGRSTVMRFGPGDGRMEELPRSGMLPHQQRKATWTGTHLFWWGGADGEGAAWRPPGDVSARDPRGANQSRPHPIAAVRPSPRAAADPRSPVSARAGGPTRTAR